MLLKPHCLMVKLCKRTEGFSVFPLNSLKYKTIKYPDKESDFVLEL